MKLQLETTIGFVLVKSSRHYIEIYTSEDSYQEGLINLWDYEKDKLIMEPTISNVIREVFSALRDYFDSFGISNIEILEGNIEELLEPDAIERLKMMVNNAKIINLTPEETEESGRFPLDPHIDRSEIANSNTPVYFAQVVMNAYLEGVGFLGVWQATSGKLLINVSPAGAKREDEKIYSFDAASDETQNPEHLAEYFQDYIHQIIRGEADDYEVSRDLFPKIY